MFFGIDPAHRCGRRVAATFVVAAAVVAACGGATRSGREAPGDTGGSSSVGGESNAGGAADGGGARGGGGATSASGGVETGGVSQDPACPAEPPVDGESCGDVDLACFYGGCPGDGVTRAGCLDSVWHVRTPPCCPETPPADGQPCPGGDEYDYCVYGDCPGGEVVEAACESGSWYVLAHQRSHPCCPAEPPGVDSVVCGPDLSELTGSYPYSCAWQDCGSYGVADGDCNTYGTLTSSAVPCERFFCGNGNTDPDYFCEAGQVCINYRLPVYVPGGVGDVFRCADNPCARGGLEIGCLREFICPTADVADLPYGGGIYVYCLL